MRGLWTFEHGQWDLRVRADFPRIDQIGADEAVAEFVMALNTLNGQEWERESDTDPGHPPRASGRALSPGIGRALARANVFAPVTPHAWSASPSGDDRAILEGRQPASIVSLLPCPRGACAREARYVRG